MLYFENDYCEGAHPAILQKLTETNFEKVSGYGTDPYCASAREKIRAACACPEADVQFISGGTQSNAIVIASMLQRWQGVVAAATGHVAGHEAGAIEYTGHKVITLPTANGKITARQVQDYVEWHKNDESTEHIVQPGMVYISHPTEGGTLYTKAELTALYDTCRRYGLPRGGADHPGYRAALRRVLHRRHQGGGPVRRGCGHHEPGAEEGLPLHDEAAGRPHGQGPFAGHSV